MNMFKISVMIAALAGVIYAIVHLKTGGLPGAGLMQAGELSWCKTRVKSVSNKLENIAVHQEGMEWKATAPAARQLEPTYMEKWLGQNCKVKVDGYLDSYVLPGGQTETVMTFIDDQTTTFLRTEENTFIHQGTTFKSRQLELALRELFQTLRQP
ncbi:MAG TPA: hypothetical protein VFV50_13840 [Bdellovibrionales bacterium]|nr:hypothetical protein [Bdellovibrionales bacterium]